VSQIVREFDDKEDEIGLIRVKNHPSIDILEVWLTYWDKLLDIIVALARPSRGLADASDHTRTHRPAVEEPERWPHHLLSHTSSRLELSRKNEHQPPLVEHVFILDNHSSLVPLRLRPPTSEPLQ
jgi:hypothetical protein